MSTQDVPAVRQELVDQTMARLAEIEARYGATREGLDRLEAELKSLARHRQLFVRPDEFKPAKRGTFKDFIAYRLNRDDGSTRALYVSLALPGKTSPPHNHKNWAVLVGLDGVEINHIYRAGEQGLQVVDTIAVGPDVGLSLLGDDIHSIDVQGEGDVPVWQLRLYERALDLQVDREQFGADGKTSAFAPNPNTPVAVAG